MALKFKNMSAAWAHFERVSEGEHVFTLGQLREMSARGETFERQRGYKVVVNECWTMEAAREGAALVSSLGRVVA